MERCRWEGQNFPPLKEVQRLEEEKEEGIWYEAQTWEDKKCVDIPQLMQHIVTNFNVSPCIFFQFTEW